ncbi:MAG: hypothetical protein LBT30_00735 [Clostridiales bacterium]|jgi:uncharacterized membrane protein YesL|nr:hypothetical protein [Clostridiales bacterium]
MAKKWYTLLTPAKEERIRPSAPLPPSAAKAGRIKRTWDIFFLEYSSLFKMSILFAVTFFPFLIFCFLIFGQVNGLKLEYAYNTGIGYPLDIQADNLSKILALFTDIRSNVVYAFLLLLVPGPFFAGAFNVAKLLMWGHSDVKVLKTFFDGVKKHWWKYAAIFTVFCAAAYGTVYFALTHYIAMLEGHAGVGSWIALIIIIIAVLSLFCCMMYAFSMIPVYKLKFTDMLKNSALMTFGIYPLNILAAALSAAPFLLILTGNPAVIIVLFLAVVFIGPALYTLIWTSFCQYGFESFINKIYQIYLAEKIKLPSNNGKKKIEKPKQVNKYENPKKKKK